MLGMEYLCVTKIRAEHPSNTSARHIPFALLISQTNVILFGLTAITRCRAHIDGCSAP